MTEEEMARAGIIFHTVIGSKLHGLNLEDSDRDEYAVCIEPLEWYGGFDPFEQVVIRDASKRGGGANAPSQPGDLDLKIVSLRKFLRLALQGNPEMMDILFVDTLTAIKSGANWQGVLDMRDKIISHQAINRYLGYMKSQMARLIGAQGQKGVNRPELEEKYGYDVDYARHIIKLGLNGVELITTGKITLPMPEPHRSFILAMRRGEVPMDEAFSAMLELENKLLTLRDKPVLPLEPDRKYVEERMLDLYWELWKCHRAYKTYMHLEGDRLVPGRRAK